MLQRQIIMIFCNSELLGSDFFFFTLNLRIIKLYIDRLDIVLPCRYLTISPIQICKKTAGQSVIIQPQLNWRIVKLACCVPRVKISHNHLVSKNCINIGLIDAFVSIFVKKYKVSGICSRKM